MHRVAKQDLDVERCRSGPPIGYRDYVVLCVGPRVVGEALLLWPCDLLLWSEWHLSLLDGFLHVSPFEATTLPYESDSIAEMRLLQAQDSLGGKKAV